MLIVCALLALLFATFFLTNHGGEVMYAIWVVAIFFIFSGTFALLPSATCQTFGQKYFGPNYGLVFTSAVSAQPIDYRCEDSHFPVCAGCVAISNPDSLSSGETGVNRGIRS
jgi:hypothetical protein